MHRLPGWLPPLVGVLVSAALPATALAHTYPMEFAQPPPPPCPDTPALPIYYYSDPAVAPPPPSPPRPARIGLGLRGAILDQEGQQGSGVGAVLRLRALPGLEVELAVDRDAVGHAGRVDSRYGVAALAYLGHGTLSPYLLVGAGVIAVHEPCGQSRRDAFVSAGGGVAVRLSSHLSLAGEVRWSAMKAADGTCQADPGGSSEHAREGSLLGVYYF